MATKAKAGTAVRKWDEELAGYAAETAKVEENVGLGKFISTRGGRLSFNGNEVPGNKMNVVVVDYVLENQYYTERFDPDNPTTPACFAFGRDEDTLAPHEKVTEPQHEGCKGCPMNEFGSADTGKGKACKNIRRLALLTEDGLEDIESTEIAYLKVPVTSVKSWSGYVRSLNDTMHRPPFAVVTEVSAVPDGKTQFKLQFKFVRKIEDGEALDALIAKKQAGESALVVPYSTIEREQAPARPLKGAAKPARTIRR